jgi:hypothetical protein
VQHTVHALCQGLPALDACTALLHLAHVLPIQLSEVHRLRSLYPSDTSAEYGCTLWVYYGQPHVVCALKQNTYVSRHVHCTDHE